MEETSKKIQVGKIRIRFFNFYAVICLRFQRPSFNDFIKIYSAPVWFSFSPLPPPSISLSFSLSLSLVSLFPWFSRCFPKRAPGSCKKLDGCSFFLGTEDAGYIIFIQFLQSSRTSLFMHTQ